MEPSEEAEAGRLAQAKTAMSAASQAVSIHYNE